MPAGSVPYLYFNHAYDFDYGGYYRPPVPYYLNGYLDGGRAGIPVWMAGIGRMPVDSSMPVKVTMARYCVISEILWRTDWLSPGRATAMFRHATFCPPLRDTKSVSAGGSAPIRSIIRKEAGSWTMCTYTCQANPSIPQFIAPANNGLVGSFTPVLSWSNSKPSPDHYEIQLATDTLFSAHLIDVNNLKASNYAPGTPRISNTTYYWRVRSFNAINCTNGWRRRTQLPHTTAEADQPECRWLHPEPAPAYCSGLCRLTQARLPPATACNLRRMLNSNRRCTPPLPLA